MNSHTAQVFFYELRRNVRRKGYLFTTFGIPLLVLALIVGYQFISSRTSSAESQNDAAQTLAQQLDFENVKHAGYVDLSGMFGDPGDLAALLTPYPDEATAQAALESGEIALYYVIASDYMTSGEVTIVQPRLNISEVQSAPIRRLILNTLSQGVEPKIFQRLINPSNVTETNLALIGAESGTQDQGSSFIVVYVFAIILALSLFATNGYLMQSVIEEKETRLIEILISTVRPTQLLAGKILALGLLGLVQIVAWIAGIFLIIRVAGGESVGQTVNALTTIANIKLPLEMMPILLLYFVLSYFLFAGLYSIVGAMSNSLREGPQYAVIFTLPAALPFYFVSVFSTTPNATIPVVLSLFPITAPLAMVQRLVITSVPAWQIVVSLLLLALTAVFVMRMAGRLFRVQVLLAGQMPKLKDIPRLLRG